MALSEQSLGRKSRSCWLFLSAALHVSAQITARDEANLIKTAVAVTKEALRSEPKLELADAKRLEVPCKVPAGWCQEGLHISVDGFCTPLCNSSSYSSQSKLQCLGGVLDPPYFECRSRKQWYGGLVSLVCASLVFCVCCVGLAGLLCSSISAVRERRRKEPTSYGPGLDDEELEPLSRQTAESRVDNDNAMDHAQE
eukprot:TRINITY_DN6624_c0_g1_i1.p1 TRINITY_DN6624_c0_g1~~TRINITY_DN6624_c0_g1_i1.p1  ORF type:complete len:205 (-),score=28.86 TRINITY_DN6624_c0_g1_i1:51-641(-)